MANEFRNNHYVPEWYQRRFLLPADNQFHYLNLKPDVFTDPRGITHIDKALKRRGPDACFKERDLYTRKFRGITLTEIESRFFGEIDTKGKQAVEYFNDFSYPLKSWGTSLEDLMIYMSTQKLRTPKGLEWLATKTRTLDKDWNLRQMIRMRDLHAATWVECVWLIADATQSNTKFIVSDHPVTVCNRRCSPKSDWCREVRDPDIWLQGTHTVFPLSIDKVLILTNLSWVRNPYQSEVDLRPNPNPWRNAIFKYTEVQTERYLSEQEVLEINYIIKKRAHRYIAAAKEEWLYPETKLENPQWHDFGGGYLLMPDPRSIHWGGTIMWGNNDGTGGAMDEYGRRPWESDFEEKAIQEREYKTLPWFQGEFAAMMGPFRRGRSDPASMNKIEPERDDDDYHNYHLGLRKKTYKERKAEKGNKESSNE